MTVQFNPKTGGRGIEWTDETRNAVGGCLHLAARDPAGCRVRARILSVPQCGPVFGIWRQKPIRGGR